MDIEIYFRPGFGCVVCPMSTVARTPIRVVIDPVMVLEEGFTPAMLGEAVLSTLERSKTAPPVPRVDQGAGRFWQVTGIRGFTAFSRKFQCVDLRGGGSRLDASLLIREPDGGYVHPEGQPPLSLPADAPPERLGTELLALFSPDPAEPPDRELRSFETLHGLTVTYRRPSDAFADQGDGHTDAYQIFALEDAPQTCIAFLIDNGYRDLSGPSVLRRWQTQYGPISGFRFRRSGKPPLLASAGAAAAKFKILSRIYRDGSGTLEVLSLTDHALPPETQKVVLAEYQTLIRSIFIQPPEP